MDELEHIEQYMCCCKGENSIEWAQIKEDFTDRALIELVRHPLTWFPLYRILEKLKKFGKHEFCQRIFQAHTIIPKTVLLEFWEFCITNRENNIKRIEEDGKITRLPWNGMKLPSALTDPLLIDCKIVRQCRFLLKKPGWELLRYIDPWGRRGRFLQLPEILQRAIELQSAPAFCMAMDMTGEKMSFSLLKIILDAGMLPNPELGQRVPLFRYLLEHQMILEKIIPIPELVLYILFYCDAGKSVTCLTVLEELYPGIIRTWRDTFGRDLLWYTLHFQWRNGTDPSIRFLIEHGCDPDRENAFGLSWKYIVKNLYRHGSRVYPWSFENFELGNVKAPLEQ